VALSVLPTPAWADDFAPEISSFRRVSPDLGIPLQPVVIEFTATDQGASGMAYAMFTYRGPTGAIFRVDSEWMGPASEGTFQAKKIVGPWAASGTYVLERVEIYDREGNLRTYEPSTSPQFDFASPEFRVDNPNEDITAPIITSATLWQDTVKQGDPVVVLYSASDNLSGVASVTVAGWTATRDNFWIQSLPGLGAAGPASWIVPLASPPGGFEVTSITVIDRAENSLRYTVGEPINVYPEKTKVPVHDHPDPSSLSFVVEGGPGDPAPPEVTSVTPLSPSTRSPGDQVAMDYTARDEGTGVALVRFTWRDSVGHELEAIKECGDVTTGPTTVGIEGYRTVDRDWQLSHLSVTDHLGNWSLYRRDGSANHSGPGYPAFTHDLDLSRGDFRVEAGNPQGWAYPDTSRDRCPLDSVVSLGTDDGRVVAGETVPLEGEVMRDLVAVPLPVVAMHEYTDGERPRLVDVSRGAVDGTYHSELAPTENTSVRATFLGSAGPQGAEASASKLIPIRVSPKVTASFDSGGIRLGRSATLSGDVWPDHPNDEVKLQRKKRGTWRRVRSSSPPVARTS